MNKKELNFTMKFGHGELFTTTLRNIAGMANESSKEEYYGLVLELQIAKHQVDQALDTNNHQKFLEWSAKVKQLTNKLSQRCETYEFITV